MIATVKKSKNGISTCIFQKVSSVVVEIVLVPIRYSELTKLSGIY
jgi:hypothetical protein